MTLLISAKCGKYRCASKRKCDCGHYNDCCDIFNLKLTTEDGTVVKDKSILRDESIVNGAKVIDGR